MRKKTPFSHRSLWGILLQYSPFIIKVVRFPLTKDNRLIYKDKGNFLVLLPRTCGQSGPPRRQSKHRAPDHTDADALIRVRRLRGVCSHSALGCLRVSRIRIRNHRGRHLRYHREIRPLTGYIFIPICLYSALCIYSYIYRPRQAHHNQDRKHL